MEADGVSGTTPRWRDSERGAACTEPLTTLDVGLWPRLYVSVVRARLIRDDRLAKTAKTSSIGVRPNERDDHRSWWYLKRSMDGSRLRSRLGVRL